MGFFALFCLGEMTYPDDPELHDPRKVTKCNSVRISPNSFQLFLPGHKADRFFEGNIVIIRKNNHPFDPHKHCISYIWECDKKFPFSPPLWLTNGGVIPTWSFFIKRLRQFFDSDTAGQSLRAGGTTSLTKNGVPPSIIQAIGRWASDAFKIYIWKNPVLIQALLFSQTACSASTYIHALDSWTINRPFFPLLTKFSLFFIDFSTPYDRLPYSTFPYDMNVLPTHACTLLFALAPHITHYAISSRT